MPLLPSPPSLVAACTAALPGRGVCALAVGSAGSALFGVALRTAVAPDALPGPGHLAWAVSLPAVLLLSWALCLPALYVLWAVRPGGTDARACAQAAAEAVEVTGHALAATAPVLWFFAASAPGSRGVAPLALAFTGLALVAGGGVFGAALRRRGARLGEAVHGLFLTLLLVTFAQCAAGVGLRWS